MSDKLQLVAETELAGGPAKTLTSNPPYLNDKLKACWTFCFHSAFSSGGTTATKSSTKRWL